MIKNVYASFIFLLMNLQLLFVDTKLLLVDIFGHVVSKKKLYQVLVLPVHCSMFADGFTLVL